MNIERRKEKRRWETVDFLMFGRTSFGVRGFHHRFPFQRFSTAELFKQQRRWNRLKPKRRWNLRTPNSYKSYKFYSAFAGRNACATKLSGYRLECRRLKVVLQQNRKLFTECLLISVFILSYGSNLLFLFSR